MTGKNSKGLSVGTDAMVSPVAYQMGRRCPVGKEIELFAGLTKFWPTMPIEDARDDLLKGLADRFNPKAPPLLDDDTPASAAAGE